MRGQFPGCHSTATRLQPTTGLPSAAWHIKMFHVKHPDAADAALLTNLCSEVGVLVSDGQASLLLAHLSLVLEANRHFNLTAIRTWREGMALHIADSLTALTAVDAAPAGPLADLGSGAGYPGIPLAVLSGRPAVLVESSEKKARFLESVVATTGMSGIEVVPRRAEQLAVERPGGFAVVVARAVASLAALAELASPLLAPDGLMVALKGLPGSDELAEASSTAAAVGMEVDHIAEVSPPGESAHRTLVVFRKAREPRVDLPRRPGQAQKRPVR